MNVGIVGAGIAGLGAAIALRRAGHSVQVFEKSTFKNEIGAAILLTPNGNRILREWGFDFDKARPVDFEQFRFVDAATLEVFERQDFAGVEGRFGGRMCSYHRVDLHSGLRELAEKGGAVIKLGCEVVDVEPERGVVHLKNGETIQKDLWVMADGCHTTFLPKVTGEDIPTAKIGKSVYRWLAPLEKVREHPDCARLWNDRPGFVNFLNKARGIFLVTYPCRGQELLNCALFHNTKSDERSKDGWHGNTELKKVMDELEGAQDAVRWLPQCTDTLKVYTVTQRPPSTRIYNSRLVCIGDTTHHMLPTHAQGGCSGLEDAAALGLLFDQSTLPLAHSSTFASVIEKRLALFQYLRLPRTATTQILSANSPTLTMEGVMRMESDIRKFYSGELIDWPKGLTPWCPEIRDFWYGYDVFRESKKIMEWVAKEEDEAVGLDGIDGVNNAGVKWFK
ncbi:FAD/NAD(P)-binding domain-containing protein [Corynespora cassiicola Philippines]|uniref:FAD/NAD(P)-binding domain-containing protein n=1 Tax=Corynespora cassiicola Philippines TaxID=1448308 RepID=A0A2T2PAL0_CORCC|nr:FAD/NAD(P)-binding domain-containing protein [Corynespora cassiicola Philippines]